MTTALTYQSVAGPNVYWGTNNDDGTIADQTVAGVAGTILKFRPLNTGATTGTTGDAASAFIESATVGVLQCKVAGMYAIDYKVLCQPTAAVLDKINFWMEVVRKGVQGTGATGFVYRYGQTAISARTVALTTVGNQFFSGAGVMYLMPGDTVCIKCTNQTTTNLTIRFATPGPPVTLSIERLH